MRPRDRERETWTGRRAGVEGAVTDYGAAMAYPIDELDPRLPALLGERDQLYYALGRDEAFTARVMGWLGRRRRPAAHRHGPTGLLDARPPVHEMRLLKEPEEIERMRRAIAISAEAHRAAMGRRATGRGEYEIEALIDYVFRRHGASGPAYPSIVAGGANATILHYTTNDSHAGGRATCSSSTPGPSTTATAPT